MFFLSCAWGEVHSAPELKADFASHESSNLEEDTADVQLMQASLVTDADPDGPKFDITSEKLRLVFPRFFDKFSALTSARQWRLLSEAISFLHGFVVMDDKYNRTVFEFIPALGLLSEPTAHTATMAKWLLYRRDVDSPPAAGGLAAAPAPAPAATHLTRRLDATQAASSMSLPAVTPHLGLTPEFWQEIAALCDQGPLRTNHVARRHPRIRVQGGFRAAPCCGAQGELRMSRG